MTTDAIGTSKLPDRREAFSAVCNRGGDVLTGRCAEDPCPEKNGVKPGATMTVTVEGSPDADSRCIRAIRSAVMRVIALKDQVCLLIVDPQGATKIVPDDKAKIMFRVIHARIFDSPAPVRGRVESRRE